MLLEKQFEIGQDEYIDICQLLRDIDNKLYIGLQSHGKNSDINPFITSTALKCILNNDVQFIYDSIFELIGGLKITVPRNFNPNNFNDKAIKSYYYFNSEIANVMNTDESNLHSEKSYEIKLFKIRQTILTQVAIEFMRLQNSIFLGFEGLHLIRELQSKFFPSFHWTLSFSNENNSYFTNKTKIPGIFRRPDRGWAAGLLGPFKEISISSCPVCIICFNELT